MQDALLRLRYRYWPDHLLGEILSKRWTETAIPVIVLLIITVLLSRAIPGFLSLGGLADTGRQAGEIGRNTAALIETIMRERSHPEQGFRAAIGIIRLVKSYGPDRLEAACDRALEIGALSFTSVNSILKNNLEAKRPAPAADGPPIAHSNIRGSRYFH